MSLVIGQADDQEVTTSCYSNGILSTTSRCKLLAIEKTNIRVLDIPGFSDSGKLQDVIGKIASMKEGNLQIISWIVRAQYEFQLKVRRVVYFLPCKGPLEKADGTLQDELNVIHHFFGKEIFKCMVGAATLHKRHQLVGFDEHDIRLSTMVLRQAIKSAIAEELVVPPIVYIGMRGSPEECLTKIKCAAVARDSILPFKFQENTCACCSVVVRQNKEKKLCVIDSERTVVPYQESKCHPCFVPKYSNLQKFAGGLAHMATLGIALMTAKGTSSESWPSFTNSDEVCINCRLSPGAVGCKQVGETVTYKIGDVQQTVRVDHNI